MDLGRGATLLGELQACISSERSENSDKRAGSQEVGLISARLQEKQDNKYRRESKKFIDQLSGQVYIASSISVCLCGLTKEALVGISDRSYSALPEQALKDCASGTLYRMEVAMAQ